MEDPFTCSHEVGNLTYSIRGAKCDLCGREWFTWTNGQGRKLWLTNPRYPK